MGLKESHTTVQLTNTFTHVTVLAWYNTFLWLKIRFSSDLLWELSTLYCEKLRILEEVLSLNHWNGVPLLSLCLIFLSKALFPCLTPCKQTLTSLPTPPGRVWVSVVRAQELFLITSWEKNEHLAKFQLKITNNTESIGLTKKFSWGFRNILQKPQMNIFANSIFWLIRTMQQFIQDDVDLCMKFKLIKKKRNFIFCPLV